MFSIQFSIINFSALTIGLMVFGGSAVIGQTTSTTTQKEEVVKHCITSPNTPIQCFNTENEALRAASGGRISLSPTQSSSTLSDRVLASSNIQAILYQHRNYRGSTLTVYASRCSGWNNMPSRWNDVVSSARTGSCGITLYENANKGGALLRIRYPGTPYVGNAMNDKASSWSLP
jgi:hypothetical protein